jgi:hypothetical protein
VFKAVDKQKGDVRVIKDCWVDMRRTDRTEKEIVKGIKDAIGSQYFLEHFVDICGDRRTDASGGFQKLMDVLANKTFEAMDNYEVQSLVMARSNRAPVYAESLGSPNRNHHAGRSSPPTPRAPKVPPHPRFRYQVVYREQGVSLYEVNSLEEVFEYLDDVVDGTC